MQNKSMLTVNDILKNKGQAVFAVAPGQSVFEALQLLGEKNIGAVLVMEGTALRGILSERDYARKIVLMSRNSKDTKVSEIMTEKVFTVASTDSVEHCMNIMSDKKIRHLPVISDQQVVGVISIGDVVTAIIRMQQDTIEHLQHYISQ